MQDDRLPEGARGEIAERMAQMADLGASVIRVNLRWDTVAAERRPTNPRDPGDAAYDWSGHDAVVNAARKNDVEVLFTVWGTPEWARDPDVKNTARWGNARPANAADYGDFAVAAATRYAPQGVRRWEAWNEPNGILFLNPQFARKGNEWVPASPGIYAELLRAFYAGVKGVDSDAVIGGAVMAPAGDDPAKFSGSSEPPGRVRPADFLAGLDAVDDPPPMDVVAHHPYPIAPPERDRSTVRYIDLYNIEALFAAIDATYLKGKPVWLTEYGFGTEAVPNYPLYFPPQRQAELISETFLRSRQYERVKLLTYFHLQDNAEWRSGVIDLEGKPKPGRDAFALPFVARPAPDGNVTLDGQIRPTSGATTVTIEWRSAGGSWSQLSTVTTAKDGTFSAVIGPDGEGEVRATWMGTARSGNTVSWTSRPVTIPPGRDGG
jgi:hypothetical protein